MVAPLGAVCAPGATAPPTHVFSRVPELAVLDPPPDETHTAAGGVKITVGARPVSISRSPIGSRCIRQRVPSFAQSDPLGQEGPHLSASFSGSDTQPPATATSARARGLSRLIGAQHRQASDRRQLWRQSDGRRAAEPIEIALDLMTVRVAPEATQGMGVPFTVEISDHMASLVDPFKELLAEAAR